MQAGQLLARIDTADLEAKLIERRGALESAKAQLAIAEKTRATNQKLLKQNFISQNAFDSSESSFNVAQGSVKSAEAQVRLAQNALQRRGRDLAARRASSRSGTCSRARRSPSTRRSSRSST